MIIQELRHVYTRQMKKKERDTSESCNKICTEYQINDKYKGRKGFGVLSFVCVGD